MRDPRPHADKPERTSLETYGKGFEEYLQSPLQPLKDNLDSATYEVFEKDPVKYISYENAIAKALVDRIPEESVSDVTCVVMVVGAGRGPLVEATLKAAQTSGRNIRVYAVEKNPGAVNTLLNRQRDEWGENVTIVSSDMRLWTAPEKADILVSELLGSFGDNELSPECLDGAQSFLKGDGVSIPCSYTSHLSPVSSAKLHSLVSCAIDKEKAYPLHQFDIPSVVYMRNMYEIAQPKVCFTFLHPNWSVPVDNRRYICLRFTAKESITMHGFAGYFDTNLYDHIKLSIEPTTYSDGMISWFPIFFPLVVRCT
ncbi:Protein arginine N-methyltransferase 5, partial [Geodia barretti]